jgi:hypothetical protein
MTGAARRRSGSGATIWGIAGPASCVIIITACYLVGGTPSHTSLAAQRSPQAEPVPTPTTSTPSPRPKRTARTGTFPMRGSGTFTRATGSTPVVGNGRLMRYIVVVEDGIGQNTQTFAHDVDRILDAPRGWTAGGLWSFKRVSSGPYDFVVNLASPIMVAKMCGEANPNVPSQVDCRSGQNVVINVLRWVLLTPPYKGQTSLYHALAVNHEVGHRLGHGHMACPGAGMPAPVMQQQIFGLHGCVINGYPYDAQNRFISGPPAP